MVMPGRPPTPALISLLLLAGCTDASQEDAFDGLEPGADDGSTDGADGDTDPGDDGGETGGEDGIEPGEEDEGTFARDIALTEVTINQGSEFPIARGGVAVAPDDREEVLVEGRPLLVRAYWALDQGFEPREIEGRLALTYPDGHAELHVDRITVDGPSSADTLSGTFHWLLDAEDVIADMEYSVGLFEPGLEDGAQPASPPRIPAENAALLGVPDHKMSVKVALVPVVGPGATDLPNLDEANLGIIEDRFYESYPVVEGRIVLRVLEPLEFSGSMEEIVARIEEIRSQMTLDPDGEIDGTWFFHGVVCPSAGGGYGYGLVTAPVAATPVDPARPGDSAQLMVHETGHNMGRGHAPCGTSGTDAGFPYDDGTIGAQGFSVLTHELFDPAATYDYMSYCSPSWTSDFGWERAYVGIKNRSQFD